MLKIILKINSFSAQNPHPKEIKRKGRAERFSISTIFAFDRVYQHLAVVHLQFIDEQ